MIDIDRIAIELYGKNYKTIISNANGMEINEIHQALTNKAFQMVRSEQDSGTEVAKKLSQVKKQITSFMNDCRG